MSGLSKVCLVIVGNRMEVPLHYRGHPLNHIGPDSVVHTVKADAILNQVQHSLFVYWAIGLHMLNVHLQERLLDTFDTPASSSFTSDALWWEGRRIETGISNLIAMNCS